MVDAGVEIEADGEPRTAEDLQHLVVVAKYVGLEDLDAGTARDSRQGKKQLRADAVPLGDI